MLVVMADMVDMVDMVDIEVRILRGLERDVKSNY